MRYICDRCAKEIKVDVVRGIEDGNSIRVSPDTIFEAPYDFLICGKCSDEFWEWIKPHPQKALGGE